MVLLQEFSDRLGRSADGIGLINVYTVYIQLLVKGKT